jgi:serine O-acetyltransferase
MNEIRADAHRVAQQSSVGKILLLGLTNRTFRPVLTMRLVRRASGYRILHALSKLAHRWAQGMAGLELPAQLNPGPGLLIAHGWGIVVNKHTKMGSNVTLFNGVVIGQKDTITPEGRSTAYPSIGNDVWVGPHAIIIGGISIGDGAIIGPGSVVTKDVPPQCVVVGNPARILRREALPDVPNPWPV